MAGLPPPMPLGMQQGGDQPQGPQTAVDFWELGEGAGGQPMTQDYEFSEIVNVQPAASSSNPAVLVLAVLLLVGIAGAGWFVYTSETDPVAMVMNLFGGGEQETVATSKAPPVKVSDTKEAAADSLVRHESTNERVIDGNPYWYLPNGLDATTSPLKRTWTPEEEEQFRSGMAHPYTYQRFKTVKDVLAARLRGSEAILWDALNQPKFWTRMWALVGLAEFNIPVSLQVVEETIGAERSELVADYFERFVRKSSSGQRYIMRQAVRLLEEKARVNILKSLERANDSYRDLYVVAATMDPGRQVQAFVRKALARRPISPTEFERLRLSIASGDLSGVMGGEEPSTISDVSLEKTATGTELEDDFVIDETLDIDGEYDGYGVEFYEADQTSDEDYEASEYEVDENF